MKRLIYYIFLTIFLQYLVLAEEPEQWEVEQNYDATVTGTTPTTIDYDGNYIPAEGVFKVLVVFVRMKEDTNLVSGVDTPGWPAKSDPAWLEYFVDSSPNYTGNFEYNNLSQYFWEMSNGTYHVIGDVYDHVYVTQYNTSHYSSVVAINNEVLQAVDADPSYDFSDYDNWKRNSQYDHENVPDGKVDKIIIIYRNNDKMTYTGSANFAITSATYDGVSVSSGFANGSGIQQRGGKNGFSYSVYITAHELGHHLLGASHLGATANISLMNTNGYAWNGSRGMCSWERERLGWITYTEVYTSYIQTKNISDYFTSNDNLKINTGTTGEYFLLENRQQISIHDKVRDKGLFILHVTNGHYEMANIDVECADGNWAFSFNSSTEKISRVSADRNGKDELDYRVWNPNIGDYVFCSTPYYHENSAWGDSDDAFNKDFNPIFSPWSNPQNTNSGSLSFSMEVTDETNGVVELNLNFLNPADHSPSKPQNLQVAWNGTHPQVTWDSNLEPDMTNTGNPGQYRVYRKIEGYSYWQIATTLNHATGSTQSWIDTNIDKPGKFDPIYTYSYKVTAIDNTSKESLESYSKSIDGTGFMQKYDEPEVESVNLAKNFYMLANYPNPFNPQTHLTFSLPEKSEIYIRVFDISGRLISTLAQGIKDAGDYNVVFNASDLPSGIYITNFKARSMESQKIYSQNRRMLLLK